MKYKKYLLALVLITLLFAGCAREDTQTPQQTPQATPPEAEPDVVTTASIVDNEADFKDAISDEGTWIICLVEDITIEDDIVLDGRYTNGKKDEDGNEIIQRKVALYTQDENRNVSDKFTLTAPKFTINSPKASIQHGTFKGDLYVTANDFELVDTRVEGNVYFTTEESQSTFTMDDESEITGEQELAEE